MTGKGRLMLISRPLSIYGGNAVFGTCLATGEKSRWERYDVLGEIKPECMPDWAKEALAKIKEQQKEKNREER